MPMQSTEVRATKLRELLGRLEASQPVTARQLRTWLGDEGYAAYANEREEQKKLRKELRNKPGQIVEYDRRLTLAVFKFNVAEHTSQKGRLGAGKMFWRADRAFEGALEYLQEIIGASPELREWFDRDTDWSADGQLALGPSGMPRVVTSRSLDNAGGGILQRRRTNRQLKIDAVEREIDGLSQPAPVIKKRKPWENLNPEKD